MTRWTIGEADIDTLISKRHLEVVVGDAANGAPWLDIAVEQAIVAQFREAFGVFGALRRGRNRVEYPKFPKDQVTREEAAEALDTVETMLAQARKLLPSLGLFSAG